MRNEFTAVVQGAEDGWFWAWSPDVREANGQGRTEQEAIADLAEAIALVLEVRRDEAECEIPQDAVRRTVSVG